MARERVTRYHGCNFAARAFPELRGLECCSSCHYEWEDGYVEPMYIKIRHHMIEYCCGTKIKEACEKRNIKYELH